MHAPINKQTSACVPFGKLRIYDKHAPYRLVGGQVRLVGGGWHGPRLTQFPSTVEGRGHEYCRRVAWRHALLRVAMIATCKASWRPLTVSPCHPPRVSLETRAGAHRTCRHASASSTVGRVNRPDLLGWIGIKRVSHLDLFPNAEKFVLREVMQAKQVARLANPNSPVPTA